MKIKKKFGDKIYIEWVDAYEKPGWRTFESACKIDNELFCRTNTFFLEQKDGFIKVAHTIGKTKKNDMLGVLLIPEKWVLKIR